MPSALFTLPSSSLLPPTRRSQPSVGRFSGRGWADPMATAGQVRVRLWAVSRGRRHACCSSTQGAPVIHCCSDPVPAWSHVQAGSPNRTICTADARLVGVANECFRGLVPLSAQR